VIVSSSSWPGPLAAGHAGARQEPVRQDPKDPHLRGYVQQGLLGPTVPDYYVFNVAMAEVRTSTSGAWR